MIVHCPEVKEVVITDPETGKKEKLFAYQMHLDPKFPQNKNIRAALIQFATHERRRDIEPGEYYTISLQPFVVAAKPERQKKGKKHRQHQNGKEKPDVVQGQDG